MDFLRQPSAEELEEREYRQALEVIANHRRRQAEEQAAIRRQQLAEAARQRYFAALAAKLEQRRQEELLAARRAELIRARQVRERLVAAERQHAINAFLRQLDGPRPVCDFRIHVICTLNSNRFLSPDHPPAPCYEAQTPCRQTEAASRYGDRHRYRRHDQEHPPFPGTSLHRVGEA